MINPRKLTTAVEAACVCSICKSENVIFRRLVMNKVLVRRQLGIDLVYAYEDQTISRDYCAECYDEYGGNLNA